MKRLLVAVALVFSASVFVSVTSGRVINNSQDTAIGNLRQ